MKTIEHWIDGKTTSGTSTRTSQVWNPATGEQQAQVLLAAPSDVEDAVRSATTAFESWSQSSLSRRAKRGLEVIEYSGPDETLAGTTAERTDPMPGNGSGPVPR